MKSTKTLILIRHAHRDTSSGRNRDNGLSVKGKKQRAKLTSYFLRHYNGEKVALFSSPSKRCVQTLKEIASATNISIKPLKELSECTTKESAAQFKCRLVKGLEKSLGYKPDLIVLCSHGDWIPLAAKFLCGIKIELSKGGWMDFQVSEHKATLKNVFQTLE